ncbi:HD domain-containing protein [Telmatocola sphagniphila]|uniref:HD domain-containing protein n=1 Tax=Telmatocola sphagniphila TaxID=1123043 RepID=A0A8E6B8W7_9BACT|nr:HD domain-containing protein [Telmatocola sphagniphila]QVL33444.1 HD domain-containing protein [Telmatocola sphagniphila]
MDRAQAWKLVQEYVKSESLRGHMRAVELAMRAYARKWQEDEELWALVGLLHDFDYERYPDPPLHPLEGEKILKSLGVSEEITYAIKSHADYLPECPRVTRLHKALYACDELCGFITAVAHVRPEKFTGMTASSVRKKMKSKGFAKNVSREDMERGAADLGVDFDEHIQFVIDSLTPHAVELGF